MRSQIVYHITSPVYYNYSFVRFVTLATSLCKMPALENSPHRDAKQKASHTSFVVVDQNPPTRRHRHKPKIVPSIFTTHMCYKVKCRVCRKWTWDGCGEHIEQTLRGIPEEERCVNWRLGADYPCNQKFQSLPSPLEYNTMGSLRLSVTLSRVSITWGH